MARPLDLIAVPFDGMARVPGQAGAPAALREAGLREALARARSVSLHDVRVPEASPGRAGGGGFLNQAALFAMLPALRNEVEASVTRGAFPLIHGADCSVLLAAIPALRGARGAAGLVFLDGHEDATSLALGSGEAANMEIALLLGYEPPHAIPTLDGTPALAANALTMLGVRDANFREPLGVPSVADRVRLRTDAIIAAAPAAEGSAAARYVARAAPDWWLHVDLDVLAVAEFSARGAAGEPDSPGGLTWSQLTEAAVGALSVGGCRGLSVVIYNPDLDPDRVHARRIVRFIADLAESLP